MNNKQNLIFVIPWYGKDAHGGAETLCRMVVEHLNSVNISVKVFTTCSKEFSSEWENDLPPGKTIENNISVTRFKIDSRDKNLFDTLNQKILSNQYLNKKEELEFFKNNINSSDMMKAISDDVDSLFVFLPYLYGTTFFGGQIHPKRTVVIPCLHDEGYAKMNLVKKMLSNVKGLLFNSNAEKTLAEKLLSFIPTNKVIGLGMDYPDKTNPEIFKRKYNLNQFILCSGRKEEGKNTPLLVNYFSQYLENHNTDLKLVLTGKGKIDIPKQFSKNILDIFLSREDLNNAFEAATIFCLPSVNESFSIVLMESWIHKVPVLVNNQCDVTKEHCINNNGGLYFDTYLEFEACVNYFLNNPDMAKKLGENGFDYVKKNYEWNTIVNSYADFFQTIKN
jgi:glycosyltransferase involved in cell wall biosynthesis